MNQLLLTARIAEISALRYTPAGLPVVELQLDHESQQNEAQAERQVKATVKAVAIGLLAERVGIQILGTQCEFKGFLASNRLGKSPIFHLQDFQIHS